MTVRQQKHLFQILLICMILCSWTVPVQVNGAVGAANRALISVGEELIAQAGRTLNVPINISMVKPLSGLQLSMKFDSESMIPEAPVTTARTAGMSVMHNVVDDQLIVLVYDASGAEIRPGDGPVLTIPFSVLQQASGEAELSFRQVILADEKAQSVPVDVKSVPVKIEQALPVSFDLLQNYPNPFNPETAIEFQLPEPTFVSLTICNVLGQGIRKLVDERKDGGYHEVIWDGKNDRGETVSSGIYLYRLNAGDFVCIKKMMMLK